MTRRKPVRQLVSAPLMFAGNAWGFEPRAVELAADQS